MATEATPNRRSYVRFNWHHFKPVYLPGYSPDFKPIGWLWPRLKADWFWDFIARTEEQLTEHLCTALKNFIEQPNKTALSVSFGIEF